MNQDERELLTTSVAGLFTELLKWRNLKGARGIEWQVRIVMLRRDVRGKLEPRRRRKADLDFIMDTAYERALRAAAAATDMSYIHFPGRCPWDWDEIFREQFWPDA